MARKDKLKSLKEADKQRKEARENVLAAIARKNKNKARHSFKKEKSNVDKRGMQEVKSLPPVTQRVGNSLIDLFVDDDPLLRVPSSTLIKLADLYLHAAEHRTRHIALVWPAPIRSLTLVHTLATIARWREGDKQGVRGVLFPVKSNVFYPLNHIHLDRTAVLDIANRLAEVFPNSLVKRSLPDKDAYFYSLSDTSLPNAEGQNFNPTVGELLPTFFAAPEFQEWKSCADKLLSIIRTKLLKRSHAKSLKELHCKVIGSPASAPDALFALDGRMSNDELNKALKELNNLSPPEVVVISATRAVRSEALGWRGRTARFCMMLEEIFQEKTPGVIIVTDEPHSAYKLKDELWKRNNKRESDLRWKSPHEYKIDAFPSIVGSEELLLKGAYECLHPMPKEFEVYIVDSDVAKVANKLTRIARDIPCGKEGAKPLIDAAAYVSRIAALPCGIKHLAEYLSGPDIAMHTRVAFDWPTQIGVLNQFDHDVGVGEYRSALMDCIGKGSELYVSYQEATPFAHKLADLVANAATGNKHQVTVVFTSALYRRLAERFLAEYRQYPGGILFEAFNNRVHLISATNFEEHLAQSERSTLVFAGLNEVCLRLILTDDRVPAHSVILLTQRAGQFLRASLKPIIENFSEFRSFKPRIESILRQLKDLPNDASVLSTSDYTLPTFRIDLSSEVSTEHNDIDSDTWIIRLDNGTTLYRRDSSEVYVYDPTSLYSSDRGFKACQIKSLEVGDKLFVMSAELREMVEHVLRQAGVPIHTDKTFEAALRSYHEQVQTRFSKKFSEGTITDKVRELRKRMLELDPKLEDDLPKETSMRQWIDLGESPNTPFEELRPQAPRSEAAFKAFADVLEFSSLEAAYQWQRVIMAVRTSRRLDGRHISDIYAYMLLQPESVMTQSNISRQTLTLLFDAARESVATVECIGPIKEQNL
ncbi:hypothetical protein ACSV5M_00645 [Cellvibrio sp. ARAG 10.3]|uniref:hypothetical protein n=1 Tax=Cellvibrio sp. ARAG 10.3 TaxID=3451358 RepID=UPI003F47EFBA